MNITYKFELNTKPGADGRHTVFLRITANRKLRRIKTPVAVKPSEFDKDGKNSIWVSKKNPAHKRLNDQLWDILHDAEKERNELDKRGGATQPALLERLRNPPPAGGWTLGGFADKMVNDAAGQSVGYQRNLKSHLKVFVDFTGPTLPLSSVTLEVLNRFKRFLQQGGKMAGTQHTYFMRIRRMMLEALKLELIEKDPFLHFDSPRDKPAPRLKLSDQQLMSLESVDVGETRLVRGRQRGGGQWLFRAKWLYLFAFQMGGIRSRDVLQLRWANIVGPPGGERVEYQMSKTGESMSTKLTRKAKAILELFRTEDSKGADYVFGVLDNAAPYAKYLTYEDKRKMPKDLATSLFNAIGSAQTQINSELKTLASRAGISDRLTFHTSRHSFADKARRRMKESKNISIDDIRQALGHSRLDTTQRYLNSFDREGLDSAMSAIFDEPDTE